MSLHSKVRTKYLIVCIQWRENLHTKPARKRKSALISPKFMHGKSVL